MSMSGWKFFIPVTTELWRKYLVFDYGVTVHRRRPTRSNHAWARLMLECLDRSMNTFHAYSRASIGLLASSLLAMRSYTHGSHSDRSSCFLSFCAAPVESWLQKSGQLVTDSGGVWLWNKVQSCCIRALPSFCLAWWCLSTSECSRYALSV